jgi:hypothetical protein
MRQALQMIEASSNQTHMPVDGGNKKAPSMTRLFKLERETRLELATPTLARLCSTN